MKYGVLLNKDNRNIGDDIQAFACQQYLPSVDYFIDREHIDDFISDDGEPVAVIMNAWYMWKNGIGHLQNIFILFLLVFTMLITN